MKEMNKIGVKIAIVLLIITMVVSNIALVLFFNHQIDLLNQEISDLVKRRWRATEEMFSNETHTVVALKFFAENWTQIAEMNYLFYGNIEVSDTLEFVDVYASLYQIPNIESYKKVTPLEVKTIEDLANLIIPPFYLNTTNVEQRSAGNRSIYLVTAVNRFLFNFTAFEWIPTRTVVFTSANASEAIQWAIDNSGEVGQVVVSGGTYYLTKTVNITRSNVVISGGNFTIQNATVPAFNISKGVSNIAIHNCTFRDADILVSKANYTGSDASDVLLGIQWRVEQEALWYLPHPVFLLVAEIVAASLIIFYSIKKKNQHDFLGDDRNENYTS